MKPIRYDIHWKLALKSLCQLYRNPNNSVAVFKYAYAINGPQLKKILKRLLSTEEGGRFLMHHPEIQLNTFERETKAARGINRMHPYSWIARRVRDLHDYSHWVTGYDRSVFGEGCLAFFHLGQMLEPFYAGIALVSLLKRHKLRHIRAYIRAYQIGKESEWLFMENVHKNFFDSSDRVDVVRTRLNITQNEYYEKTC